MVGELLAPHIGSGRSNSPPKHDKQMLTLVIWSFGATSARDWNRLFLARSRAYLLSAAITTAPNIKAEDER
jgi:hypothetical protein